MSPIYWGKEESQYSRIDAHQSVMERFWFLAASRQLQANRQADIMSVRSFVGGSVACNAVLGGVFSSLKNAGAVKGEDSGERDEKGFPYKRWMLADPEKAKEALNARRVRPMRASAMKHWQVHP